MTPPRTYALAAQLADPVLLAGPLVMDGQHAAQDVAVAAEVLGAAVHDDVGAPAERIQQWRRRERGVDGEVGTPLVRDPPVVLQVARLARWGSAASRRG